MAAKKHSGIGLCFCSLIVGVIIMAFTACSKPSGAEGKTQEEFFTITFDLGYDTALEPPEGITVKEDTSAGELWPADPTPRPTEHGVEWSFAGWYDYATVYTKDTPIGKNLALKAKYSFQNTGNPLIKHVFTADPAALVVGDTVYLYTGHDEQTLNDNSFVMHDWLCFSSTDMITWVDHGPILRNDDFSWNRELDSAGNKAADAWAAHMIERNNRFYFYITTRTNETAITSNARAIGVAVGSSPVGPFNDVLGKPLIRGNEPETQGKGEWGTEIDPNVWIDDAGQAWLSWGNTGNVNYSWFFLAKLRPNMIQIDGEIQVIPLEHYVEGPWIYQREGLWYNVYASHSHAGGNERISYATANAITGPWTFKNIVIGPFTNPNSFTIHPSVIEFKGQSYFIYHDASLTLTVNGQTLPGALGRRAVCVEYLYYNEDGSIKPIPRTAAGVTVPPAN